VVQIRRHCTTANDAGKYWKEQLNSDWEHLGVSLALATNGAKLAVERFSRRVQILAGQGSDSGAKGSLPSMGRMADIRGVDV
jgi:hypothetical protein